MHLQVRRKIIHPQFRFRITQPDRYDLALLELDREARDVFHITPICLPEGVSSLLGQKAVVAGWGKTKPSADLTGTTVLRSAEVPILGQYTC